MQKLGGRGITEEALQLFILLSVHSKSNDWFFTPSERMLGRKIRTKLDLLVPKAHSELRNKKMEDQYNSYHGTRAKHFKIGDSVVVRNYVGYKVTWIPAIVKNRVGWVMYEVSLRNDTWIRHANQMRLNFADYEQQSTKDLDCLLDTFELLESSNFPARPNLPEQDETSTNEVPVDVQPQVAAQPMPRVSDVPAADAPVAEVEIQRSTRQRIPNKQLTIDPRQKTYQP